MEISQIEAHGPLHRPLPGGRAQHAELQPAARAWPRAHARADEARIAATIEEVLLSAEYILSGGNYDLILCERGIRTYETYTRNTMDISAIPVLHKLTHLPVMADPSPRRGHPRPGPPLALAAVAAAPMAC